MKLFWFAQAKEVTVDVDTDEQLSSCLLQQGAALTEPLRQCARRLYRRNAFENALVASLWLKSEMSSKHT